MCSYSAALLPLPNPSHSSTPEKSGEVYWLAAAQSMQAAAKGLGMTFEVHDAQQDATHSVMIEAMTASRNAIYQTSTDVILDQAGRKRERGHFRDHAARCGRL
jgi:hypothetical protein